MPRPFAATQKRPGILRSRNVHQDRDSRRRKDRFCNMCVDPCLCLLLSVLIEDDRFSLFQIPTTHARCHAVAAISGTVSRICWDNSGIVSKLDVCHGQLEWIFGLKNIPRAEHEFQILRESPVNVKVIVNELILFRETEKVGIRNCFGHTNHHFKIRGIGDIARTVPAEITAVVGRDTHIAFILIRFVLPKLKVILQERFHPFEGKMTLAAVTLAKAGGVWAAGAANRQADGRYPRAELGYAVGDVDMT